MERKELGKIQNVHFGLGGYKDVCIGIHFALGGEGWGVCSDMSAWDSQLMECSEHCKWTEKDRSKQYDEIVRYVSKLLHEAKVDRVDKLVGIPVEVNFSGNVIKNWRILKEVL